MKVSPAIVTCLDNLSVFVTSGDNPAAHPSHRWPRHRCSRFAVDRSNRRRRASTAGHMAMDRRALESRAALEPPGSYGPIEPPSI